MKSLSFGSRSGLPGETWEGEKDSEELKTGGSPLEVSGRIALWRVGSGEGAIGAGRHRVRSNRHTTDNQAVVIRDGNAWRAR